MAPTTRPPQRVRRIGAAMAVVGVVLLVVSTAARAQGVDRGGPPTVSARASAEGVRFSVAAPGYLLVDVPVDSGGPVTQAVYETFGERTAYAAAPYPGDLVTNLPGLAQAFGVPAVPFNYPLIATAADPSSPSETVEDPSRSYVLHAEADPKHAAATGVASPGAFAGGPGVRTASTTTVEDDGTVRAKATTTVDGLVVAGVLDLGVVRSTIEVVLQPGTSQPSVTRTIDVAGASVGGIGVKIGAAGVEAAGTQVPGLDTSPVEAAINAALAAAEVEARIVKGSDLPGGGLGNVLEIRSERTLPLPGDPQGTISMRIGGSSASIITGDQAPQIDDVSTELPAPAGGSVASSGAGDSGSTTGGGAAPTQAATNAGVLGSNASVGERASTLRPFDFDDGFRIFYLALVLGGVALVVGSWRSKGGTIRRVTWIS